MVQAVIFDLWETIGSKGYSFSQEFQKQFHISNTTKNLHTYEEAIHFIQLKKMKFCRSYGKTILEIFFCENYRREYTRFYSYLRSSCILFFSFPRNEGCTLQT